MEGERLRFSGLKSIAFFYWAPECPIHRRYHRHKDSVEKTNIKIELKGHPEIQAPRAMPLSTEIQSAHIDWKTASYEYFI